MVCGPGSSPQRLELVLQCDGFVKLLRVRNFKLGNHLQDISYYIENTNTVCCASTCISTNLCQESCQLCFLLRAADNLGQLNESDTVFTATETGSPSPWRWSVCRAAGPRSGPWTAEITRHGTRGCVSVGLSSRPDWHLQSTHIYTIILSTTHHEELLPLQLLWFRHFLWIYLFIRSGIFQHLVGVASQLKLNLVDGHFKCECRWTQYRHSGYWK